MISDMNKRSVEQRIAAVKVSDEFVDPRMPVREALPEFSNGGVRVKARADKRKKEKPSVPEKGFSLKSFYGRPLEKLKAKRQELQSDELKKRRDARDSNTNVPIWARSTAASSRKSRQANTRSACPMHREQGLSQKSNGRRPVKKESKKEMRSSVTHKAGNILNKSSDVSETPTDLHVKDVVNDTAASVAEVELKADVPSPYVEADDSIPNLPVASSVANPGPEAVDVQAEVVKVTTEETKVGTEETKANTDDTKVEETFVDETKVTAMEPKANAPHLDAPESNLDPKILFDPKPLKLAENVHRTAVEKFITEEKLDDDAIFESSENNVLNNFHLEPIGSAPQADVPLGRCLLAPVKLAQNEVTI